MANEDILLKFFKNLFKLKSVSIYFRMRLNPLLCLFFEALKHLGLCFVGHLLYFFDCPVSGLHLLLK